MEMVNERIKEVSALVFERSKASIKDVCYDDKTLQTLTVNALKLLPLPLRIFLKKNKCFLLRDELAEMLRKHGLEITTGSDSSLAEKIQRSSVKEPAVLQTTDPISEADANISIPLIEKEKILYGENELQKLTATFVERQAVADEKSESTKTLSGLAIKQSEKPATVPIAPLTVAEPLASMPVVDSQRTNYAKFAIIGIVIIFMIVAGFFIKSYLNKPAEMISKPQPIEPVKPFVQSQSIEQKPLIAQPKEQPPAVAAERPSKSDAVKSSASPMERPISAQKVKKLETASPKEKSSVAPESLQEPAPKEQERKSFAPHSRDDL